MGNFMQKPSDNSKSMERCSLLKRAHSWFVTPQQARELDKLRQRFGHERIVRVVGFRTVQNYGNGSADPMEIMGTARFEMSERTMTETEIAACAKAGGLAEIGAYLQTKEHHESSKSECITYKMIIAPQTRTQAVVPYVSFVIEYTRGKANSELDEFVSDLEHVAEKDGEEDNDEGEEGEGETLSPPSLTRQSTHDIRHVDFRNLRDHVSRFSAHHANADHVLVTLTFFDKKDVRYFHQPLFGLDKRTMSVSEPRIFPIGRRSSPSRSRRLQYSVPPELALDRRNSKSGVLAQDLRQTRSDSRSLQSLPTPRRSSESDVRYAFLKAQLAAQRKEIEQLKRAQTLT